MQAVNHSSFLHAPLVWLKGPDRFAMTVVVKGTFDLVAGGVATIAAEPLYPTGDEPYPDDDDGVGCPRYESDFAYHKPRADVLVVGTCHPPRGREVRACPVTIAAGTLERTLMVLGERRWSHSLFGWRISEAVPFTHCEVRYENAYGGPGYPANPVGKGHESTTDSQGRSPGPLPNLEDPKQPVGTPLDGCPPAGFGPLRRTWPPRFPANGSYDAKWLKEVWPGVPADFDWGCFNAAPRAQQVDGYLRGDEELRFEGLHPDHLVYRSRLPGLRPRFFVDRGEAEAPVGLEEVELHLDTVWADLDNERLVLVWRGITPVADEELSDLRYLYVAQEELSAPRGLGDHQAALVRHLDGEVEEVEAQRLPPVEPEVTVEEVVAAAEAEIAAGLAMAGLSPAELPEGSEEARQEEAALLAEMGIDPSLPTPPTREEVAEKLARGEGLEGDDLRGIDLSGLPFAGAHLAGARLDRCRLTGVDLTGADLTGATLVEADVSGACFAQAILTAVDLTRCRGASATFDGANLDRVVAEEATFTGATFVEASAAGSEWPRANLEGATFSRAGLVAADLADCAVALCRFDGADLCDATLEGAHGEGVNLSAARIDGIRAANADLAGATLRGAVGQDPIFEGADLHGADCRDADFPGGDFTRASLAGADLHASDLRGARFLRADLAGARVVEANLFHGSLERANLSEADLSRSNLYGVELLGARLEHARLDGANLKQTKLEPQP